MRESTPNPNQESLHDLRLNSGLLEALASWGFPGRTRSPASGAARDAAEPGFALERREMAWRGSL